jgi:malonyl-CoA/methylmalonyl-CoA synthetase
MALPDVELRVADEHGTVLPAGETGVIEVRGPNVFKGYWRMPEKTKAEIREDGFFITGDVGRVDEKGYVWISGRAKDLIISGGFNVYPKEVEEEIDQMPGVEESAVIGVPHPDFGEAVIAVATARTGQTPPAPETVIADLKARLAGYKVPKQMFIVPELPRNSMGKVQKNLLREQYKDLFAN